MDRRKNSARAGFTLVEVLVAILIIATLVAILLPAVRGAFRRAQEAQVASELNNLATALTSFQTTYNEFPPSRVILCEAGYNNAGFSAAQLAAAAGPLSPSGNDSDITVAQLIQRSKLYLRKFWPRVDFDNGSNGTNKPGFDFNGDGMIGGNWTLSGSECLTFFLGGLPIQNGNGTYGLAGFSKLPTNPFIPASVSNSSTNRTVPYYEFNIGRLVDLDGDHFPSYIDPLDITPSNQRAYAYFASYGTNSYDPNDVNGYGRGSDQSGTLNDLNDFELEDDGMTPVERTYSVGFLTSQAASPSPPYSGYFATSPTPNPYTTGTPITPGGMSWINPNSFQLFCAGADRTWGLGGQYVQTGLSNPNNVGSSKLPLLMGDIGIINSVDFSNGIRIRESDNLTNFSGGRLD